MKTPCLVRTYCILALAVLICGCASAPQTKDANEVESIAAKAKSGDAFAQYELGIRYFNGDGVQKDWVKSVKWWRKAAEQNLAAAQNALAGSQLHGYGTKKSETEACKWYALAAAQGIESAKTNLGIIKFFINPNEVPLLDFTVNSNLHGHWSLISSPENSAVIKFDLYFLTENRFAVIIKYADKNGQSLPARKDEGRYYFTGNQLYMCSDTDKEGSAPNIFSITNTQMTFYEKQGQLIFQKAGELSVSELKKMRDEISYVDKEAQYLRQLQQSETQLKRGSSPPSLLDVNPNAYGLGINSDQFGRPQTYRTQDGQKLSPIFQGGVKRDAYGLGVHSDQFGRPVHDSQP